MVKCDVTAINRACNVSGAVLIRRAMEGPRLVIARIMMSGEAPTPAPHGDHRYDVKDSVIAPSLNSSLNNHKSIMVDQEVQIKPEDFPYESPKQCSETILLKDMNPNSHQSTMKLNSLSEKKSLSNSQLEKIENADDVVLAAPGRLDVLSSSTSKPGEMPSTSDHTDGYVPKDNNNLKNEPDEDDSNCLVNCLYYVDQCCQCRIV